MKHQLKHIAAGLMVWAAATAAFAQDYPTRTVKIVVPYGPGTGIDLAARVLAERLTKSMGQPFVIENKSGAAGTIGTAAVASAVPDGYTLLMNASGHTTVPALMKNAPYDAKSDFVGVAVTAESAMVLVTSKARGYQSVKDLVAAGKAKPGSLTYASAGIGTATHFAAEKFRVAAGFQGLHVPYKSTTDALAEVMSGRIDFLVTTLPTALGPVKDGRLVALAIGTKRSPSLPDVPTMAEAGLPNAGSVTWFGMFAPARTPAAIVARLNAEVNKIGLTAENRDRLAALGADPTTMSLAEVDALLKREFADNEQIVKVTGIKIE